MRVVVTDYGFPSLDPERAVLEPLGLEVAAYQAKTPDDVIAAARDADALLVQWAPITAEVIGTLDRCRVLVRYGIGVDNVDLAAAAERGLVVCNVPDYCLDEVADHTMALALASARQIVPIDARVRSGTWKISPDAPMPSFRAMTFGLVGYGRIAQAVAARARAFGFRIATYDPFADPARLAQDGVEAMPLDRLIAESDLLSLHAPLTPDTKHLLNADTLATMKPTARIVNTSRGGLIDGVALADALARGVVAGAALDVFEAEPLPDDHPLRSAPNAILTSHVAWYSEQSLPALQRLAAEEAARVLRGESPKNPVVR